VKRWIAAAGVMTLLCAAAACTSPTSSKQSAAPADNSSTVGITKGAVHISLIVADLSILSKQHLAPDLGDPVKAAQAAVADINAHGGVAGGRKLVLSAHTIPNAPTATTEVLQRACVQATEEDKSFAVIIAAAVPVTVTQCVAVAHQQLAITMDSWQQQVYDDAHGRIFSVGDALSVSIERAYAYFPKLMQSQHALDGKTVGILNQDQPADRTAAATALKHALTKLGIKVAAEATAPYIVGNTSCSQTDTAIQKMKQAHVDFVFLVAQNLCAASLVTAAQAANFKPQWATMGNNVTDTVAQFMAPAKNDYDGAWGVSGALSTLTRAGQSCASMVSKRAGLHYAPGSDAYSFTALTCQQIRTLADALKAAKAPLTQGSVIRAFEGMSSVPLIVGPNGSLSATKHDAGNVVWLEKYSAAAGKFQLVDQTPHRVP
jgi:ABC-type branched-subunit amino acid transport system substrate-binding protein